MLLLDNKARRRRAGGQRRVCVAVLASIAFCHQNALVKGKTPLKSPTEYLVKMRLNLRRIFCETE